MKQKTLTRAAGRDGARREAVHHRREAHGSRVRVKATGASALRRVGCPSRASSRRGRRRPGARRLRDRLSESWERRRSRHGRAVQRRRRRFAPRRRVPVAAVVVVASDAGSLPMPLWTSQHCRGRGLAHTRPTVFLLPVSLLRVAVSPRTFFSQALSDPVAVGPDRDSVAVDRHGTATTRVETTSASGAPDDSSLSHFSVMTWPCWLRRAVMNRHRHAIEQASRRWRRGRRDDSARRRRKILISTQATTHH